MSNGDRALEYRSICDGFSDDFKDILNVFCKTELKFANFVQIWNDTQFNLIYSGRTTGPELLEFTEEAMCVAAHFMLNDKKDRPAETCGLFMIYSLFCTQNSGRKPYVRVPPDKAILLKKLKEWAESGRNLDVLYILCSLLRDGVFRFVATEREYGLEKSIRKYIEGPTYHDTELLSELTGTSSLKELVDESLDPVADILKEYQKAKCKLPGASRGIPCRELNYLRLDFINDIKLSLDETLGQTPQLGRKEDILKKYLQTPTTPLHSRRKRKKRKIGRPEKISPTVSNPPPKKGKKNSENATISHHMELYCSAESENPEPGSDDNTIGQMNMPIIIMEEYTGLPGGEAKKGATIKELKNEVMVCEENSEKIEVTVDVHSS